MRLRRDALAGAARIALELRDYARDAEDVTANVGKIAVEPGGGNVVPGVADFTIDVRAASAAGMRRLESFVKETVERVAADEGLTVDLAETFSLDPLELDAELVERVANAAEGEGARAIRMPSGAGHDAMIVGRHVPAAMLFVARRAQRPRGSRARDARAGFDPSSITELKRNTHARCRR
jgi:allantoate deiminase